MTTPKFRVLAGTLLELCFLPGHSYLAMEARVGFCWSCSKMSKYSRRLLAGYMLYAEAEVKNERSKMGCKFAAN